LTPRAIRVYRQCSRQKSRKEVPDMITRISITGTVPAVFPVGMGTVSFRAFQNTRTHTAR